MEIKVCLSRDLKVIVPAGTKFVTHGWKELEEIEARNLRLDTLIAIDPTCFDHVFHSMEEAKACEMIAFVRVEALHYVK